jgi:hypothetical protein
MKTYILAALLFFGAGTFAIAQNKIPTAQELTTKDVTELEEKLKLSPTQKSVIYNYTFEMYKQQLDLYKRQQAGTAREEEMSKFNRLQLETNDNIRSILKGEQVAQFDQLLDDRMNGTNKKKSKKEKKKKEEGR